VRDFSDARTLADGLGPWRTLGPFSDIGAVCSRLAARLGDEPEVLELPCAVDARWEAPAPGLDEAAIVIFGAPGLSEVDASLVVRLADAWYLAQAFEPLPFSVHGGSSSKLRAKTTKREGVLDVTFTVETSYRGEGRKPHVQTHRGTVLCALDAQRQPWCTSVVPHALESDDERGKPLPLAHDYPDDGTITIDLHAPTDDARVRASDRHLLGSHRITPKG
jgi:hypothetical protein